MKRTGSAIQYFPYEALGVSTRLASWASLTNIAAFLKIQGALDEMERLRLRDASQAMYLADGFVEWLQSEFDPFTVRIQGEGNGAKFRYGTIPSKNHRRIPRKRN